MATNILNKYVWLVETIYNAGRITFKEINRKWIRTEMSEGVELSVRTFHKWRIAIEELFDLDIECDRQGGFYYYIYNTDDLRQWNIRNWLLKTISVGNQIKDSRHIKDRILLEDIPSGEMYLSQVIEAMKNFNHIGLTYKSYRRGECRSYVIYPYFIKLFKQRWYVVSKDTESGSVKTFSLDRIVSMEIKTDTKFEMPEDFDCAGLFCDSFGIMLRDDIKPETIKLKAYGEQANYMRSLPLHKSQREVENNRNYSVFTLRVSPTIDFIQEILRWGEQLEVLEPQWLRNEIYDRLKNAMEKYSGGI